MIVKQISFQKLLNCSSEVVSRMLKGREFHNFAAHAGKCNLRRMKLDS